MENEKQKNNYSITSKGVESQISGLSLEIGDEFELFKASTRAKLNEWRLYTRSLESEKEYKKFKEPFSFWSRSIEEPKTEETQSTSEIDIKDIEIGKTQNESELNIKDRTINTLVELLKYKDKTIKEIRFEISQKNKKIDDLQTTQKLKLEKVIEENTLEIRALKETINRYQEIIRPPSLTQEDIERYLSRFITEDKD